MEQRDAPLLTTALLFGPLVAGVALTLPLERRARAWHRALRKWPRRPPPAVHALMWVWSYLSLGYASHALYAAAPSRAALRLNAALYALHLALLNGWAPVFYALRRVDLAFALMLVLDAVVALSLPVAAAVRALPAVLCAPYLCWLLLLTYMNWYMLRHNRHARHLNASKQQLHHAHHLH